MIEKIPVLGRLLLWTWRIINLPLWFRQLRDHFLNVASDVDSLKSSVSGSSALIRSLRASLDAQDRAAQETKASLEGLSADVQQVAVSVRDTLMQLGQTAQEHDGALRALQASLDNLHGGLGEVRDSVVGLNASLKGQSAGIEKLETSLSDHSHALSRLNASQEGQEESVRKLMKSLSEEQGRLQDLRDTLGARAEDVKRFEGFLETHSKELRELRDIVSRAEGPVGVESFLVMETPRYVNGKTASGDKDGFYLGFENVFRGTEAEIAERQSRYVDYVLKARAGAPRGAYFLDVGCGRGEFLKLLKGMSVPGKGLEVNRVEYEKLKAEGLDVALSDANAYLGKLGNGSLTGISAFQVVEHFPLEYLKKFLTLAYRKTARNGVIILETVNPKCGVALRNFFLDLTHVRPYPPELLKFLLEWHGYGNVAMVFSVPCAPPFRVKDFPECNYMDYAAVGWKR